MDNTEALPAFVFQTATHLCLHHYRSRGREDRAFARLRGMGPGSDSRGPLDHLVTEESREAVRRALSRLSAEDRDLLTRIYYEDEDTALTARALDLTPGALRVRKHRALARLAGLMGEWGL